jgi:hypothetical protein
MRRLLGYLAAAVLSFGWLFVTVGAQVAFENEFEPNRRPVDWSVAYGLFCMGTALGFAFVYCAQHGNRRGKVIAGTGWLICLLLWGWVVFSPNATR